MSNKVVSKYFSHAPQIVMDGSLSDFQERKKYNTGPKNVKKTKTIKKLKRTRGQKDIRALIKKQENEVISYSKNFDKVCKQAGVDVDSEELQLAIALSKSLNEVKNHTSSETDAKNADNLTSQQRTLKIKTTLQEYGFKVGETKIISSNKRKKCKKPCKLLLISEAERQQIISDKYSEVLVGSVFQSPAKVLESDYTNRALYYKTTHIAYEYLKNDDIYYVKDLFDKPGHKSNLLRDWSAIPGRALSPIVEVNNIRFDDIICDQHELDCILSGSILTAQHIVTNKNTDIASRNNICKDKAIQLRLIKLKPLENDVGHIDNCVSSKKLFKETNYYTESITMSVSQVRCISPDLFDDEVSTVLECTDNGVHVSGQIMTENIDTYCMDLTECAYAAADPYNSDLSAKLKLNNNHKINITNRKTNDFMEITKCVSTNSEEINIDNIDLTQSSNDSNEQIDNVTSKNEINQVMDLTQDSDAQAVKICYTKNDNLLDDTIILIDEDLKPHQQKQNLPLIVFPQPICIDMDNCKGNIDKGDCKENTNNITDYVCDDSCKTKKNGESSYNRSSKSFEIVYLDGDNNNSSIKKDFKQFCQSSINSFSYHENNWEFKYIDKGDEHTNELVECQPDEIDLTQSSNSYKETKTNQLISNYSISLGKRDNISIDYDEVYDDIVKENNSQTCLKLECHGNKSSSLENKFSKNIVSNPNKSSEVLKFSDKEFRYLDQSKHDFDFQSVTIVNEEKDLRQKELTLNNDTVSNLNNSSEIFNISDKEFNYSLHQSKHENLGLRDVSVMHDFSNFDNKIVSKDSHQSKVKNQLCESNIIPRSSSVSVIQSHKVINSEISTPIRLPNENAKNILQTPKNGEYIIKTIEVTPMHDYASMSSPERHKELEKYGLKPFKRKRAIQLLTYLYNQTHPVVESHNDNNCLSPSKRRKKDDGDKYINLPKNPSKSRPLDTLTKSSEAPLKPVDSIICKKYTENGLYAVTNEQPDITKIECNADDWVFQKREKAKLPSCRVPLHVAFHNYVTCRRRLREAILRYEPVNIDFIHKDLVDTGYRYNPKDLLKFMDRKCITVRTADNNSRNRKS